MANFLYVDNSNVAIEGKHVSAVAKGLATNIWEAQDKHINDHEFMIDFGQLLAFAGGDQKDIGRAVLYGSRPPANDSLWEMARKKGFEVVTYDRNAQNKEKKIDTKIASDIIEDLYTRVKPGDEMTLVAGDRDYVPVAEKVMAKGVRFDVVFWDHAGKELREGCSKFVPLNAHLELLRYKR
jgi:uncharacterized LabA/DUF88 family protein